MTIEFNVNGRPTPQGSKSIRMVRGRPIMFEQSSADLDAWRDEIKHQAIVAGDGHKLPIDQPVLLEVWFRMPRPQSCPRLLPSTKPDLDKLVRAVCDAITSSHLWLDDSLVCSISALKMYAEDDDVPGARVKIETLEPATPPFFR